MSAIFGLFGVLLCFFGFAGVAGASSAIAEGVSALVFLSGVVLLSTSAVIYHLVKIFDYTKSTQEHLHAINKIMVNHQNAFPNESGNNADQELETKFR